MVSKNMFGKIELSQEEWNRTQKELSDKDNDISKLTNDYNRLVKDYNALLKISKEATNKNDTETQKLISKGAEQTKVITQLRQEVKELADELKRSQALQLNDYELELQNAKTKDEVEALKMKHREIMRHRKMRRMVLARGEKHDY